MKKAVIALLLIGLVVPDMSVASEGQGVPVGVPDPVTNIRLPSPVYAVGATTTDLEIQWDAPNSDGGSALIGYSAVAVSGASFDQRSGATCSVSAANTSCTIIGMSFGTTYKIEIVANNAVGSSAPTLSDPFTTPSTSQTVSISGAPGTVTFGNTGTQLSATATSGLPVTWSVSAASASICSVDNTGRVTYLAQGDCEVIATQDGSGSSFSSASASVTIQVGLNASASASSATSVTGTSATLNGSVPYPGADTSVRFCISTTDSSANCSSPSGVSVGGSSPSTVTATSSTTPFSTVSGLTPSTTYYFWVEATVGGNVTKSSTSSFTTLVAPSLSRSGPTSGQQNSAFSTTITASGGSGVFINWGVDALPAGLALSPSGSEATITGTPTIVGTTNSIITVTDSNDVSTSLTVTFTISAPPPPPQQEDTTIDIPVGPPVTPEENNDGGAESGSKSNPTEGGTDDESKGSGPNTGPKPGQPGGITEVEKPVTKEGSDLPVSPGTGNYIALRDSVETPIQFKIIDKQIFEFSMPDLALTFEVQDDKGLPRILEDGRTLNIVKTDSILIQGIGLLSGTTVTVWIFSNPTLLGKLEVKGDGSYRGLLPIPSDFPLGNHTIQVNGITYSNEIFSIALGVGVVENDSANNGQEPKLEDDSDQGKADPDSSQMLPDISKTKEFSRTILFAKSSRTITKFESNKIMAARKLLKGVITVTCVGYTKGSQPSKSAKKLVRERSKATCSLLLSKKRVTFKTKLEPLKAAPPTKRSSSSKPGRVDIRVLVNLSKP